MRTHARTHAHTRAYTRERRLATVPQHTRSHIFAWVVYSATLPKRVFTKRRLSEFLPPVILAACLRVQRKATRPRLFSSTAVLRISDDAIRCASELYAFVVRNDFKCLAIRRGILILLSKRIAAWAHFEIRRCFCAQQTASKSKAIFYDRICALENGEYLRCAVFDEER